MGPNIYGKITALEYSRRPHLTFADIVEEFDIAFQMVDSQKNGLSWSFEDIAIIERDYIRLALGWLPSTEPGMPWHLVIAVGGDQDQNSDRISPATYEFVTTQIIERLSEFLPFDAALHGDAHQPVDTDLIDAVFDLLSVESGTGIATNPMPVPEAACGGIDDIGETVMSGGLPRSDCTPAQPEHQTDASISRSAPAEEGGQSAGIAPQAGIRGQFLRTRAKPTQPLRLTIHTLALSLMLYVPPLGAAMFAYTMLRDVAPVVT